MKRHRPWLLATCLVLSVGAELQADFLIYKLTAESAGGRSGGPDREQGLGGAARSSTPELRLVLPGRVQVNPGKTVSYFHPTIKEPLYFRLEDVEIKKAATPQQEYNRKVATAGKDTDEIMKAAIWALKKGLLREFHAGVDKVLDIDPKHEAALRIKELKKQIDKPLPENPETEKELRSYLKLPNMQIATSDHFIMLHDVPTKPPQGKRKNRAQERLDLLEQVYESFLLLFHAQDIALDIPKERMKVVLFKEHKDYEEFSTSLSPSLSSASGFWEPIRNVSVFYDHGTNRMYKALQKLQAELKKLADDAKKTRSNPNLIRFVKTLDLLIEVDRENSDITVVSHEATHQMAGNTGLLPRHVEIPSWVHEGLATYFESPGDAAWAGIGAVSEERLIFYRALENDRLHSNIDFIVADQIFDYARGHGALLHGYGQAWALTHFLMENHLKELVAYYRMLGEMPPDVTLNPSLLTTVFNHVFGSDHKALDLEWRQYMRSLKTDLERLEEASPGGRK